MTISEIRRAIARAIADAYNAGRTPAPDADAISREAWSEILNKRLYTTLGGIPFSDSDDPPRIIAEAIRKAQG
ncbi:MAG: hypothetical protein IPK85_03420 [Gemmatimonadetes bacterium]|nr:hypothetical protein [Gemmatimonadota bacterium]